MALALFFLFLSEDSMRNETEDCTRGKGVWATSRRFYYLFARYPIIEDTSFLLSDFSLFP